DHNYAPNMPTFFFLLSQQAIASTPLIKSEYVVSGIVVSSTCSEVIEHNASQTGIIDFSLFNKARESGELTQSFTVRFYVSTRGIVR
ncbi:hypothetical protein, partial [Vibrio sp. 10N.222.55.F8]|uniref:hypothetical protein n=1 Tax=Vibrio sp. 10N.222.55.F8 TaxID=3229654 RepID=UPI00355395AF